MKNAVIAVYRDIIDQLKREKRKLMALAVVLSLLLVWKEMKK